MKTILFLHGFFASGSCVPAKALIEALDGRVRVLMPDLPLHPKEALEKIRLICEKEQVDLLVGNSCGSFYAQQLAPIIGIPALLGNPHFRMTEFLKERIGAHQYKSPRADGKQDFVIDEALIEEFAELEDVQFDYTNPYYKDKVWGIFGEQDTLAQFEPLFLQHYNNAYHFPGAHTPTAEEVKTWHAPLIEKMLMTFERPAARYFQHFKGGKYRFVHSAFDSETQERMVVYQALYGNEQYWVRPEKMFFEKVTRDGKTFNRFTEIEKD
ncbi:MAG: YqiA/YcfP family alpha/beta fold hydrolase [Bacteroidales bacterium]|nr:YqiA/YcfP family alpha/beta fold hydrolase [Bacteroidales bacterium]